MNRVGSSSAFPSNIWCSHLSLLLGFCREPSTHLLLPPSSPCGQSPEAAPPLLTPLQGGKPNGPVSPGPPHPCSRWYQGRPEGYHTLVKNCSSFVFYTRRNCSGTKIKQARISSLDCTESLGPPASLPTPAPQIYLPAICGLLQSSPKQP